MNRRRRKRIKLPHAPLQPRKAEGIDVSCLGKIAWWSLESAEKHAIEVNNRRIGDREIKAYECRTNNHRDRTWHVGREQIRRK